MVGTSTPNFADCQAVTDAIPKYTLASAAAAGTSATLAATMFVTDQMVKKWCPLIPGLLEAAETASEACTGATAIAFEQGELDPIADGAEIAFCEAAADADAAWVYATWWCGAYSAAYMYESYLAVAAGIAAGIAASTFRFR